MISFEHLNQVGVEGEDELVAVLEFYTGLGLIAYWGWSLKVNKNIFKK